MKIEENIPYYSILKEFANWSDSFNRDQMARKAQRVWIKCMRRGHTDIARKIWEKYKFPLPDDRTIAFMWTLLAQKQ